MQKTDRIFVAGHRGLIGSALVRCLRQEKYENLALRDHSALELTDAAAVENFFHEFSPKYVVLAAGRVGGIVENQNYPADFMNENIAIQLNVLRAARKAGAARVLFFGSSCMYPRECPQPMAENILLTGKPEPTSMAYAMAKLAGVEMCLSYNKQDGQNQFIPVIPNSVYGSDDNFDSNGGHVLSALIRRFHEAKSSGEKELTLWGSGSPRREFLYSDDLAAACLTLLRADLQKVELPLNIGSGEEVSIQELAQLVAGVAGYEGRVHWDTAKPDGAPRKLLDSSRMKSLGWSARVPLKEGIRRTYDWYLQNKKGESWPKK